MRPSYRKGQMKKACLTSRGETILALKSSFPNASQPISTAGNKPSKNREIEEKRDS